MNRLLILIFVILAFNSAGQEVKKQFPYRPIRTLITDLNNDNKPDTIVLISSLEERNSFNRISISLSGYQKKIFKAKDYWTVVDSNFLLTNKNAIHTKLLFLKKTNKHAVILLFGVLDGAGYRAEFSIINIEDNNIKMVFDHTDDIVDVEIPIKLIDISNSGRMCFIFRGFGEIEKQTDQGDIGTYTPFFVYPVKDDCKLDKSLTKKYNQDHYVFAGYNYDDKIRIFYPHNGGKPRIWKK